VRFLIDECLSFRLAEELKTAGHDVLHAVDSDLQGAPDEAVMRLAIEGARVLISADTDFGELLASTSASVPSLILLRRSDRRPEVLANLLLANLSEIEDDLSSGALVVITDQRIRVRRLPIK
jgi:predicted nuclease of predicted toxin-antitoxin system